MLQKWSEKEDQQLSKIVRKYGTGDWNTVRKHFKSHRTRDSVIKRWHGKLKYQCPVVEVVVQKTKKINNQLKKRLVNRQLNIRKSALDKMRSTRSTSFRVLKSNINNRFQRLRNFVEGTKTARQRKRQTQRQRQVKGQSLEQKNQIKQSGNSSVSLMAWTKNDDIKLRALIINQGVLKWQKIATLMGCSENQVIDRWKNKIYSTIKLDDKVGGFLKYSAQEDTILTLGNKSGLSWQDLMPFLPGRSQFSIEARWRRLFRPQFQIELTKNKHYMMRQFLKKILQKRQHTYQPLQQPIQLENSQKKS